MCQETSCRMSKCGGWVARHGTSVIKAEVFHNERVSPEKLVFSSAEQNIWIDEVCIKSADSKYWVLSVYGQQQTRPGKEKGGRGEFSAAASGLFAASQCFGTQVSPTSRQVGFLLRPRMSPKTFPTSQDKEVPPTTSHPIGWEVVRPAHASASLTRRAVNQSVSPVLRLGVRWNSL